MIKLNATYHDVIQNTEEWFQLRRGVITASALKAIMGKRGIGATADALAMEKAMERCCPAFERDRITTDWMEHGHEYEPIAIAEFENATGLNVEDGGFFRYKDIAGASPDGLITGQKKNVEVKCPDYKNHLKVLKSGTIDPQYVPQTQFQMLMTGAESTYFISYLDTETAWISQFPREKQLFYCEVEADPLMQELIWDRIQEFDQMVKEWEKVIRN